MKNKPAILFQHDSLVAYDKPPGLLSVPDRYDESKPNLASIALRDFPLARPLHRLDFETSGIMLFCILPESFGWYSDQFEQRTIVKKYMAISDGRCTQSRGTVDLPLFTTSTGKVIVSKQGKPSQSRYEVLDAFKQHTLFEVIPLTGRTHQVRVHLASIGHPITGDKQYGSAGPLYLSAIKGKHRYQLSQYADAERPMLGRVALHASSLSVTDYRTGVTITIESELAKDMKVSLLKLKQWSPLS